MLHNPTISIKTDAFEGPLDLLIELVEKRKLLISDISLAVVTDEYIEAVAEMQELSLPNTAQFIELASTLVLIKSKSLLPVLDLSSEEESAIEDLSERLKVYQSYRIAGEKVRGMFGQTILFAKPPTKREVCFKPDNELNIEVLGRNLLQLLESESGTARRPSVQIKSTITLEDMIKRLEERIKQVSKIKLSELVDQSETSKTTIVGFLAILETVRSKGYTASQAAQFSDIQLESREICLPRY